MTPVGGPKGAGTAEGPGHIHEWKMKSRFGNACFPKFQRLPLPMQKRPKRGHSRPFVNSFSTVAFQQEGSPKTRGFDPHGQICIHHPLHV